ncbi:hypothetical protein GOV07_02105 [Candidatus Woesearchaeota archaeon]|nr:hypothetical protein [Candidatus Woesearchaeota archaeon]
MKRFVTLKTNLTDVEGVKDAPSHTSDTGTTSVAPGYAPVLETAGKLHKWRTLNPIIVKGNYGITEGGLTAADPEVVGSGITEGGLTADGIENGITEGVWTAGYENRQAMVKIGHVPLHAITIRHEPIKYEAMR